jgi:hypothetical protein
MRAWEKSGSAGESGRREKIRGRSALLGCTHTCETEREREREREREEKQGEGGGPLLLRSWPFAPWSCSWSSAVLPPEKVNTYLLLVVPFCLSYAAVLIKLLSLLYFFCDKLEA